MIGNCTRCGKESLLIGTRFGDLCLDCLEVLSVAISEYATGWYDSMYNDIRKRLLKHDALWSEIIDKYGGVDFVKKILHSLSCTDSNAYIRHTARSLRNYLEFR